MAKAKDPWRPFYPSDWLGDPQLRACSSSARGVWICLCSVMWLSPIEGYLVDADKQPLTIDALSRMVSERPGKLSRSIEELIAKGVASRDENSGAIYCRRIKRDAEKRARARKNGKKGGNPAIVGKNPVNQEVNQEVNHVGKAASGIWNMASCISSEGGSAEGGEPQPSFLAFWYAYPAKGRTRMADCKAAWGDAVDIAGNAAQIVSKASEYAKSPRGSGRYCLAAHRWLEGRCWEDAPEAWQDEPDAGKAKADYAELAKGDGW